MQKINPADLIPFDVFVGQEPIQIDLVYADANHPRNIFDTALYHSDARLWVHKDLAAITLLAARKLNHDHGYILEIKDCLRTTDAQKAMQETDIVKSHPEWSAPGPNRLLSPPGTGAHPRAMAIDVCVIGKNDEEVDMGTPFDFMGERSARNFKDFPEDILNNRKTLENRFLLAAKLIDIPILPIPPEWWDFRFFPKHTDIIEPLSDVDLPPQMQMTNKIDNGMTNFDDAHFSALAKEITNLIDAHNENL